MQKQNQAIGIFDSGIGGLTVTKAVQELLPNESFIYFGDTAHLPYGDKSIAAIQSYSIKICNFLLEQNCKVILIACNSASSVAYELIKEYVGSKAFVLNVIDPTVQYIKKKYQNKHIGLIGTQRTVSSNIYKKKVDELRQGIELSSLATPLLVPMIEENFFQNQIRQDIIAKYLSQENIQNIEALILGCTHYPLIKNEINEFYKDKVEVIDSSKVVAEHLKLILSKNDLLSADKRNANEFYVSDYTRGFEASSQLFFNKEINLQLYPLWE